MYNKTGRYVMYINKIGLKEEPTKIYLYIIYIVAVIKIIT